jgi:hypothetical protein
LPASIAVLLSSTCVTEWDFVSIRSEHQSFVSISVVHNLHYKQVCCSHTWTVGVFYNSENSLALNPTKHHAILYGSKFSASALNRSKHLGAVRSVLQFRTCSFSAQPAQTPYVRYKIWGFYVGGCEEYCLLGYTNPVHTSQETHYISATESSRWILCKIWSFHDSGWKMPPSGMWRRLALLNTDVSEERITSTIKAKTIDDLGKS